MPLKDSGVAWLGKVPAHWLVMRLKIVAESIKAGPFGSALTKDQYVDSGFRVFGQEQVIPADFSIGDYYISAEKFDELQQYATRPGDILISCVGTFGKIALVPEGVEAGIINPRLLRLRVGPLASPEFLCTVLRSNVTFEQFALTSRGGTMDVINIGTLADIQIAVPPLDEQRRIVAHLDDASSKFDTLAGQAETAIGLLTERRSALISAAVTGKIDVRGLVPQPEDATA